MSVLAAHKVSVSIDGTTILDEVTCAAQCGRLTGLIGPNGAGKSTLLRAFLRLQAIDGGRLHWGDEEITNRRTHELSRRFAYLSQDQTVHWPLTVSSLVSLGRRPFLTPFSRLGPTDHAAIDEAIAQTGLRSLRHRTITTLSGGEKARVLLARVLAGQASAVLADEPIASLDPFHQLGILEILRAWAADGRAVVIVLHDLSLARRFCDDVILLDRGQVSASGAASDVLSKENLRRVYGVDFDLSGGGVLPIARLGAP